MAKSEHQKRLILKQLERYKKYELSLVPRPNYPNCVEPIIEKIEEPELPQFSQRKRGAPTLCICGVVIHKTKKFCSRCKPSNRATEGVKIIPLDVSGLRNLKPTGKKCAKVDCKNLTERFDGLCARHQSSSKNPLYRSHVPKQDSYKQVSLNEFKKNLKRSV